MRTYADPSRCPDCSAPLPGGATRCPQCGMLLAGPLGQQLFGLLTEADRVLALMRSGATAPPGPAPAGPAPAGPATPGAAQVPALPHRPPRRPVLSGASVPRILLALGALSLLVAAIVFLAVTWSVMGVGGRTLTLVVFTFTAGALTAWAARADLRGAVEALGLVALGLAVLDLLGARDAGWLGDPSTATFLTVLGLYGYAAALGAVSALRRSPAGGFTAGEVVASLGALVAGVGVATGDWGADEAPILAAVLATAALTAVPVLLRRRGGGGWLVLVVGTATATTILWVTLVGAGLDKVAPQPTLRSLWVELDAWPLVAAALVAAAVAALPGAARVLRLVAANLTVVVLAVVLVVPALDESTTRTGLALAGVGVVLAGAAVAARRPWGLSALAGLVVSGMTGAALLVQLVAAVVTRALDVTAHAWAAPADLRLTSLPPRPDIGAPWLLPVLVVSVLAVAAGITHLVVVETEAHVRMRRWLPLTGVVVSALTLVATLLLLPTPVWVVLGVLLALAAGLAAYSLRAGHTAATGVAGLVLLAALTLSAAAEVLTLAAAVVAVALTATAHLRGARPAVAQSAGVALAASVALLAWTLGALLDADGSWTALAGLSVLAMLGTGRGFLPARWSRASGRVGLEAGSFVAAFPLAIAGLGDVPGDRRLLWTAVYLTVAGAAVSLTALVHRDRRDLGWLGGALLVLASWVRLGDLGVEEPEAYTLPAAVALLVVGGLQLHREPGLSTVRALGAGLLLALVPSLLWALEDPVSLRALLLGAGALALVVAGAARRWAAPLVAGASVAALLVVREAAPWIGEAVPRWALIGAAGALLITLGVTWERRLREARAVVGYVHALR